jgi:hypothetical protein
MASSTLPATTRAHAIAAATKRTAAAFAIAVGCLVVVGWLLDVRSLKGGVLGSTVMNFNTALCFVLAGLSLWALGRAGALWRWLGLVCALLVALTGLLTFIEYAFGWLVGLNQLFVHPPPGESPLHYRMAPHAAFCVLLTGAVLFCGTLAAPSVRRRRSRSCWCSSPGSRWSVTATASPTARCACPRWRSSRH